MTDPSSSNPTEGLPEGVHRLLDNIGKGSTEMFRSLSPVGRNYFLQKFDHLLTDPEARRALYAVDYDRVPPSIDTFLTHSDYMGGTGFEVYPGWVPVIKAACSPGTKVSECILTGAQGRGKCLYHKGLIPTSDGVLTAREVYERRPGVVLSESGPRRVEQFHDEGVTDVVKIRTRRGYELGARPNHRVRVLDGGEIVWKEMSDLREGNVTLLARGDDIWGDRHDVSVEEAEVLGAWTGDGYWDKDTGGVKFSVGSNKADYTKKVLIPLIESLGLSASLASPKGRSQVLLIEGERHLGTRKRWESFGFTSGAENKSIPLVIRQSPADVVCAFMRGWFDTDGTVGRDGKVEVCTVSEELARQAQVILLNLGIISSRTRKESPKYLYKGERLVGKPCWIIRVIGRRSRDVFNARIGFNHPDKRTALASVLERAVGNPCSGTEPVYGAHDLVRDAWGNLRGRVSSRKPYRSVYSPRWGRSNLTKEKLQQMVDIGGAGHLPPVLRRIYEEDLITDIVGNVSHDKEHCYDLSVHGDPSYVGNGFISHNTSAAMVMKLYKIVRLSCLRDPARFYGLAPKTQIVFGLYMVTKKQLDNTGFHLIRDQLIDNMPYFQDVFPRSPYGKEYVEFSHGEKRILISTSSKSWHVLGLSLFAVAADEMNYFDQGQATAEVAREIVTEVSSRLESRFLDEHGDIPGIGIFISQTRTEADFLEQRAQDMKNSRHVLVDRGPRWERGSPRPYKNLATDRVRRNAVYLADTMIGKVPAFRVFKGSETSEPRILDRVERQNDGSYAVIPYDPEDKPNDSHIVYVPVNHWKRFDADIYGALRLQADCPSATFTPFFPRREVIEGAFNDELIHPVTAQTIRCYEKQPGDFRLANVVQYQRVTNVYMGKRSPIRHPEAPRYIHLDPAGGGEGRDWYGFAMVHPSRFAVEDARWNERNIQDEAEVGEGFVSKDLEVDLYFRLDAGPRGEPIDFKKVRRFIDWLRRIGFWIRKVTADGWQTVETLQRLRDKGFETDTQSVDRTSKPYISVRQVMNEGRMAVPYPQGYGPNRWGSVEEALRRVILFNELAGLEHDVDRDKIDHRDKNPDGSQGSKDIADALVGASFTCLMDDVSPSDNPLSGSTGRQQFDRRYNRFLEQGMVARYLPGV